MNNSSKDNDPKEVARKNRLQKAIKDNYKLLIGLVIGVLIMTAGIAVASKGFKSQSNEPIKKQTNEDKVGQVESKNENIQPGANATNPGSPAPNNQQAPKAPAVNTNPAPVPPAPSCNTALKTTYTNYYNSQVALENSIHASWRGEGPVDSSYYARQQGIEDARHEAKLAQLLAEYQQKLASINCN